MIRICYIVSKSVVTIMVSQEASRKVNHSQFQISATKYSSISPSNKISSQEVDVIPPETFIKHDNDSVDILVNISFDPRYVPKLPF